MILTIITFFLVLSFLVLIHEAGHFFAAKMFHVKVLEFGFGLPPKIFGVKRGETTYSINALPIGGFVRLYGEDGEEVKSNEDRKRAFYAISPWKKLVIILAGVFMNFTLAVIVISYIFSQGVYVPGNKVFVEDVVKGSPAYVAGIKTGDQVSKIGVNEIKSTEDLIAVSKKYSGQKVNLFVIRGKNTYIYAVIPRKNPPKGEGALGISISNLEFKKYSGFEAPVKGIAETVNLSILTIKGLGDIVIRLARFGEVPKEVAGPVGIARLVGQAVNNGFFAVFQLLGILSLNLAVINVLPFPALDGGRMIFVLIELVTRKRVNPKFEGIVNTVGLAILIGLIVLITRNDILRK